ncbi:MAG: DUF2865 domain-containing protein [Hyphomicrobiales bacterium]|nr:DUF2865 domain-containing protein [Hyphomicrobiales bacterium]
MHRHKNRNTGGIARAGGIAALLALATVAGAAAPALAQGTPRPAAPVPYPGQGQPAYQQPAYQQPGRQQPRSAQELRCLQLEQELSNDWTHNTRGRDQLPQIDAEIRKYDRIFQTNQAKAERSGCYKSMFIFGRSLVRTPRCLRMHRSIEDARRRLADLNQQRNSIRSPGGRGRRQNELIEALSRAGCGSQYQRESRRRGGGGWFSNLFDEDSWRSRRQLETSRITPFATYRTLCVRTCDGYYFPVSYSTLPSRFSQDTNQCRSQCAAPAELFVYRNPGEQPEQMVSADGRQAYNDLPYAWRYRKEYVKGCSCKSAEYNPAEIEEANMKAETEGQGTAQGTVQGGLGGLVAQDKAPAAKPQ